MESQARPALRHPVLRGASRETWVLVETGPQAQEDRLIWASEREQFIAELSQHMPDAFHMRPPRQRAAWVAVDAPVAAVRSCGTCRSIAADVLGTDPR